MEDMSEIRKSPIYQQVRDRLLYPNPEVLKAVIAHMKEVAKEVPWFCSSETSDVPNDAAEDEGLGEEGLADEYLADEGPRIIPARQECPFLTTKQAAHYIGLSFRTLEKMRETARGPCFRRHGRYIRYHKDDLTSWSEEHLYRSISGQSNFISVKPLSSSVR